MAKKKKRYVVIPGNGDPCPRCCLPTQIRQHEQITEKHLRQPFYFSRWFHCMNPQCKTQMHCAERYKVWNKHLRVRDREAIQAKINEAVQAKAKAREVREYASRGQVVWGDSWDNAGVDMKAPPWE